VLEPVSDPEAIYSATSLKPGGPWWAALCA